VLAHYWAATECVKDRLLWHCRTSAVWPNAPLSERLRRGKLDMIRAGEPPLHWAGVVCVGE
jgi:hypothetical protein